jgi:hypothetical protein
LYKYILVTHLYNYIMVSKNKFISDIRSFYNGLIAFFGLIEKIFASEVFKFSEMTLPVH